MQHVRIRSSMDHEFQGYLQALNLENNNQAPTHVLCDEKQIDPAFCALLHLIPTESCVIIHYSSKGQKLRLLRAILALCQTQGCTSLTVYASKQACTFFAKHGFEFKHNVGDVVPPSVRYAQATLAASSISHHDDTYTDTAEHKALCTELRRHNLTRVQFPPCMQTFLTEKHDMYGFAMTRTI